MNLHRPSAASARSGLFTAFKWILTGALPVALIASIATCSFERQAAKEAAVQTYNLGRVAQFRDTGTELDRKVAAFNDAAAAGESLTGPREAVRGALADHAARTRTLQDAFGGPATKAYTSQLKRLQAAVEQTNDQRNSGEIITEMSRTIVLRDKLADAATKKANS
jgi:hypothetical protein